MFDFHKEMERFQDKCTGCGVCVSVCPIIPMTEIRDTDSVKVMESVMALYRDRISQPGSQESGLFLHELSNLSASLSGRARPSMGLSLARGILRQMDVPVPRGLSFLLPETEFNFMRAIEAVQIKPADRPWITDVDRQKPGPSKTVLFSGCTGIMQPDLVRTTLALIRLIDPTAQALGGVDYCCGDTNLRAGNPDASTTHFLRLVEALNAFSPKNVVFTMSNL